MTLPNAVVIVLSVEGLNRTIGGGEFAFSA